MADWTLSVVSRKTPEIARTSDSAVGRPWESLSENRDNQAYRCPALEQLNHFLIPPYPLSMQRNSCLSAAGTERSDKIELDQQLNILPCFCPA